MDVVGLNPGETREIAGILAGTTVECEIVLSVVQGFLQIP